LIKTLEQLVLVVVTSLFDFAGPLALSTLLFKAYNAAATPKDIDPFIIRLHSPRHAIYRAAQPLIGARVDEAELKGRELDRATIAGTVTPFAVSAFRAGDLESFGTWVYKSTPTGASRSKTVDGERRWKRFERAVEAVAA
jgi:hypothetical protein